MSETLPYIHDFSRSEIESRNAEVAVLTDVFFPLINGVVFAVDGVCRELWTTPLSVILITPKMTRQQPSLYAYADVQVVLPSCPLPGTSGYRMFWPWAVPRALRLCPRIDLVHAHSFFAAGLAARLVARERRIPFVLTYHTMLEAYAHYAGPATALVRAFVRWHTRRLANRADVVTASTHAAARYLRSVGVTSRIEILPSGIDVASLDAVPQSVAHRRRLKDTPLILCVARLGREKNLTCLIEALSLMQTPAMLLLVGSGPERKHLMRLVQRLCVAPRVRFAGTLARGELASVYRSSDCFAFPSVTETQGLVLAEALYAELPVVAVDTPQGREVVAGSDAALVAPEPGAFACALDRVLATVDDAERRAERRRCGARYDARITTARTAALYEELLNRS